MATLRNTTALMRRILETDDLIIPVDAVPLLLQIDLDKKEHRRMEKLGQAANRRKLTAREKKELDAYLLICNVLGIVRAEALAAMKRVNKAA